MVCLPLGLPSRILLTGLLLLYEILFFLSLFVSTSLPLPVHPPVIVYSIPLSVGCLYPPAFFYSDTQGRRPFFSASLACDPFLLTFMLLFRVDRYSNFPRTFLSPMCARLALQPAVKTIQRSESLFLLFPPALDACSPPPLASYFGLAILYTSSPPAGDIAFLVVQTRRASSCPPSLRFFQTFSPCLFFP